MDQMSQSQTMSSSSDEQKMFAPYAVQPPHIDELLDANGAPRPHWQTFISMLEGIGASGLAGRWEQARRLIHENGVTYNVYGDPRGMDRPWELDPIPAMISAQEWDSLSQAFAQRARLLDLILQDVYGSGNLLRLGLLPPEIVMANPAFLRACFGIQVPNKRWLHLYAADIGRDTTGQLLVINDRTQAPSGAGYALENRIVLTRTLPEVFRACNVQRLAMFFRTLRDTLGALAPQHLDNPCVILLTPGPLNETYFEHAYLARYLGYTLVEGGDLTVRDDKVFLKTLGGLRQVDVILRRLDADFCDPLELRPDSFLGVPGLVQAVRTGHVAVANALGSSVVESAALLPYLPRLCKELLGEELKLNSVRTWWCGDESSLQYVLEHLPDLVIKPAFPSMRQEPVFGDGLSYDQLQSWRAKLHDKPYQYVAQERLQLSTTPALSEKRIEPRHVMLRIFATANHQDYTVMPGGLARSAATSQDRVVSMQRGGGSKDTWVLSSGPVNTYSLLTAASEKVELSRGHGDLPSRVADNLFWLGRYVERAESLVRLLRGILVRVTEQTGLDTGVELPCLLRAATHLTRTYPGFVAGNAAELIEEPEAELMALVFSETKAGSLRSTLSAARRAASNVRDRLSQDTWRVIFSLEQELASVGQAPDVNPAMTVTMLNRLVITLSAFSGLSSESVTRGLGWTFLDMGRRLERAIQTSNLLRCTMVYPPPAEVPVLEAILEIADSIMTYRRRYLATLQPHAVLDLLLTDETNPRSIAFSLSALGHHISQLPGDQTMPARRTEQRLSISLLATVRLSALEELCKSHGSDGRAQLDELLDRMYIELPAISDAIMQSYLSHTITSRQLAEA